MESVKSNVRYGVVDHVMRDTYEKTYQVPYGYEFITYNRDEAIKECKKSKNLNCIVEMIYNTPKVPNNKEEIFRFKDFKEGENEENN